MKKLIYVILCVLPLLISCDKDSDKKSSEYYVRYEMSATTQYVSTNRTISVSTESGTKEFSINYNSFSETFGPVDKGFTANMTVNYTTSGSNTTTLKIYVARGEEPFALKETKTSGGSTVTTSYTIDF